MAAVKLSAVERQVIEVSSVIRERFQQEIIAKAANYLGITTGDITWAKSRMVSALIQAQIQYLTGDSTLSNLMVMKAITRGLDNRNGTDQDTESDFIAYLDGANSWGYLVDDYFTQKSNPLLF